MKTIRIGDRTVGGTCPTFVVAEIGINHNGDMRIAERLVAESARCGADAVKFQTYVTEKRVARDSSIYDILKQCELSHARQSELKALAEAHGLVFFSTPFDDESVDFLASLGTVAYKIASFDLVNLALLRKVAAVGRPVLASRGMASRSETDQAVRILEEMGVTYALLHCVSAYPTPREAANLSIIQTLGRTYECPVGYSDHTLGIDVPVYAVAAGARIVEKHFTLDKGMSGPDHALSADPGEFAQMVQRVREVEGILGCPEFGVSEPERATLLYRRLST